MEEEQDINNVKEEEPRDRNVSVSAIEESRVRNDSQSANDEESRVRNVSESVNEEANKPREVAEFINEEVEAEPKLLGPGAQGCAAGKPKRGCRPCKNGEAPLRLRDKPNCPDCGKQISVHALNYSHSKVCKANKTKQSNIIIEDVVPEKEASSKNKRINRIQTH